MINTSISCFLHHGEVYLKKLRYLFEWAKDREEVALIWRPHPLLEATIRSLRAGMLEEYLELRKYFEREQIGVLDEMPDIANTVALSYGYIGEEASSVVNVFRAVGKPIFILNNYISGEIEKDWRRRVRISDIRCLDNGKYQVISGLYNGLFCVGEDWSEIHYERRIEGWNKWLGVNSFLDIPAHEGIEYLERSRQVTEWNGKVFYFVKESNCIWE